MPDASAPSPPPAPWPTPQASRGVHATVRLPGSKSLTARALLLAAIADAPSTLVGVLRSRDTDLMRRALELLGATFTDQDPAGTCVRITPAPLPLRLRPADPATLPAPAREAGAVARVDCGLAGTVMRFLPPLLALADAPVYLDGDDAARRRPLAPLLETLTAPLGHGGLGARITYLGQPGCLPLVLAPAPGLHPAPGQDAPVATVASAGSDRARTDVSGARTTATELVIDSSSSSQFLSALLLAGCLMPGGLSVSPSGQVPSLPHVAMTVACLRERGVPVSEPERASDDVAAQPCPSDPGGADLPGAGPQQSQATPAPAPSTWTVTAGRPAGGRYVIEPDLSNAGPFLAAAAVAGGCVTVPDWPAHTTQAGDAWRWLLPALGATVATRDQEDGSQALTATGTGHLTGIDADLTAVGELVPTVAALATLASAQGHASRLRGIAHLRGHETDRLAALVTEIVRLGGRARQRPDGIEIDPLPAGQALRPARVRTYADHRMATFGAIIGLTVAGTSLEDVTCTSKTLPDFPGMWSQMLASTLVGTRQERS